MVDWKIIDRIKFKSAEIILKDSAAYLFFKMLKEGINPITVIDEMILYYTPIKNELMNIKEKEAREEDIFLDKMISRDKEKQKDLRK